jgi:hypothetical protein
VRYQTVEIDVLSQDEKQNFSYISSTDPASFLSICSSRDDMRAHRTWVGGGAGVWRHRSREPASCSCVPSWGPYLRLFLPAITNIAPAFRLNLRLQHQRLNSTRIELKLYRSHAFKHVSTFVHCPLFHLTNSRTGARVTSSRPRTTRRVLPARKPATRTRRLPTCRRRWPS